MINIKIVGYDDFRCQAGSKVEDVVTEMRKKYLLIGGGIVNNNGMNLFSHAMLEESVIYEFKGFHQQLTLQTGK